MILSYLFIPCAVRAEFALLRKAIIVYHQKEHQKSLEDRTYRGEEGILRIRPEVGRSFGLSVLTNQDCLEADKEFKEADRLFNDIVQAMKTRKKEQLPGEHAKRIAEYALLHKKSLESAWERLMSYRSKLKSAQDERLDDEICLAMLDRLLEESLSLASYNLREALGYFHNICQGLDIYGAPLRQENIRFVNYVFYQFMKEAADDDKELFDLDRQNRIDPLNRKWKQVIAGRGAKFVSLLEPILEEHGRNGCSVDPLLFFALLRQESGFDPHRVSPVGAVGLTQIMPRTAKDLGMKNVYMPPYLEEARSFLGRERILTREAIALVSEITEESKLDLSRRARGLMQESLDFRDKRKKQYRRYKRELLRKGADDRLNPGLAIKYGFKYFADMMKQQQGDISLALAAYNAGPHRVKQLKGIPPYAETVGFRNRIMEYYRDYLRRLKE